MYFMAETANTGGLKRFVYLPGKKVIREAKQKGKRVAIKVFVRNIFGKPKNEIMLEMRRIDNNFFDTVLSKKGKRNKNKKIIITKRTDIDGVIKLDNLLKGTYLSRFSKGDNFFETIIKINNIQDINIRVPLLFGLINRELEREKVKEIFEKIRDDRESCSLCDGIYNGFSDRFRCSRCGKYHCSDHRLPDYHKCPGLKKNS